MNIQLNEKIFTESDVDAFLASADSLEIEDWISNHCNVVECSYTGNGEWLVDGEEHDYRDVKALIMRQCGQLDKARGTGSAGVTGNPVSHGNYVSDPSKPEKPKM